jgi:hypothetical protein
MSDFGFVFVSSLMYTYMYKEKERGDTMSANVYSIPDLLTGTRYISKSVRGEIVSAEEHPHAVFYEGCETYLVEIRKQYGGTTYRTVAVKTK